MYEADELSTAEPIMLINLNRLYRRDMTVVDGEIYNPVHIRESRAMRKVLQLSDGTMSVLADPTSAYGLETSSTAPDVVLVSITGHARWGASVNGDQFVRSKMSGSGGRSETGFRPISAGSYLIPPHDFTCPPRWALNMPFRRSSVSTSIISCVRY